MVLAFHRTHGTGPQPKEQTNRPATIRNAQASTNHFGMRRPRAATRAPSGAARRQPPLYLQHLLSPLSHSLPSFLTRRQRGARATLIAQGGTGPGRGKQPTNAPVGWVWRRLRAAADDFAGKRGSGGSEEENQAWPSSPEYSFRPSAQFIDWAEANGPYPGPRYPARIRVQLRARTPPPLLLRLPLSSGFG